MIFSKYEEQVSFSHFILKLYFIKLQIFANIKPMYPGSYLAN
jgi:hypothetical protein